MRLTLALLLTCLTSSLAYTSASGPTAMTGLLGGYKEHKDHANDASVQDAAKFAVKEVSEKSGEKLDLLKTVTASTQVVAGTNYQLLLLVADSSNKEKYVEATVYEPLGGADKKLTKHSFPDKGEVLRKREMLEESGSGTTVGSPIPVAGDSSEVQKAASFAVQTLAGQLNTLVPPTLKKVLQANSTVANGLTYNLALELSMGPSGDKIYNVAVSKDLQNNYKLIHAKQQQ